MIWDIFLKADETGFHFLHSGCRSDVSDAVMMFASGSASGLLIFIAALGLLVLPRKKDKVTGFLLLAALEVSYQLVHLLKDMIARPRPADILTGVTAMAGVNDFSMPSNHAATAFAVAFILSRSYGKRWLFYSLAVLVAVSRVYLGVHFPSDVIAGAFLGILIGYALSGVADKAGLSGQ